MTRKDLLAQFDEESELINTRTADGIEKYRKGNAKIKVTDSNGNPVKGAHITATQLDHDFKYGANIFMLDEFETEEKNAAYRDIFKKTFNMATLPFYWKDLEPERGKPRYEIGSPKVYRRPAPDLCLEYCEKNGITPKAHCLNYDHYSAVWLRDMNLDEAKYTLKQHFAEVAERYKDRIHCWEVVNELLCSWEVSHKDETSPIYTCPDVLEWSFETARKYFPDNELIINEAANIWFRPSFKRNRSAYYMMIQRAIANGASIDGIGFQFHQFNPEPEYVKEMMKMRQFSASQLYETMDCYDFFNLPTQVTEITIPAFHDDEESEHFQAKAIENYYKIWFSHKNMEAAIYWNVVDGYAAFAPLGDMKAGENVFYGGLVSHDMREKPALKAIQKMFGETYRTNETLVTDENGEAAFRGFYGNYKIEVGTTDTKASFTTHLAKGEKNSNEFTIIK